MPKKVFLDQLPDGISLELLDKYAAQKESARRKRYRKENPDKIKKQRITASKNFLNRQGFLVIPFHNDPLPEFSLETMPEAVRTAMKKDPAWGSDLLVVLCLYNAMQEAQKAVRA